MMQSKLVSESTHQEKHCGPLLYASNTRIQHSKEVDHEPNLITLLNNKKQLEARKYFGVEKEIE